MEIVLKTNFSGRHQGMWPQDSTHSGNNCFQTEKNDRSYYLHCVYHAIVNNMKTTKVFQ